MSVKVRLGIMMFLQYAIWGAWSPVLSAYLGDTLKFTGMQIGVIYSLLPLATIIAPFIGGQFADRYFSSEKVIAVLQLIGGGLLIYISQLTDYSAMMWMFFLYSLLYAPTMALTNSIAFINMQNSEKEFGQVRVWGTIGWIVAGLMLAGWRYLGAAHGADTLLLAGLFSLVMGLQSFTLPHTPPQKNTTKPWAFIEALKMLRDKNVLVFTIIAFVVATELMFYYVLTAPFLTSPDAGIGVSSNSVSAVMVIAQAAEILVLAFLLPWALPKYGIRTVLTIGILAWPLRYIIFAIGSPAWLVIASLALHGFCFVFFFAAAFIYFDTIAPSDIRNSAQSFITLVTYGLGNYVGSLFAGWIKSLFTSPEGVTNWTHVFLVPCALTILCALAFLIFFRVDSRKQQAPVHQA
ncbi:MAG TPA: MFS transporter [bacterium]|nr:MFS transporter [bacterium]HPR88850.1 MFS transporter [bacterium]